MLLLLLLTETTASEERTTKAMDIEINILGMVEGKVALNQNILSAYRLLKRAYHQYFWNGLLYEEKISTDQNTTYTYYCCHYSYSYY